MSPKFRQILRHGSSSEFCSDSLDINTLPSGFFFMCSIKCGSIRALLNPTPLKTVCSSISQPQINVGLSGIPNRLNGQNH